MVKCLGDKIFGRRKCEEPQATHSLQIKQPRASVIDKHFLWMKKMFSNRNVIENFEEKEMDCDVGTKAGSDKRMLMNLDKEGGIVKERNNLEERDYHLLAEDKFKSNSVDNVEVKNEEAELLGSEFKSSGVHAVQALPLQFSKFKSKYHLLKENFVKDIFRKFDKEGQKSKATSKPVQQNKNLWEVMREKPASLLADNVPFSEFSISHNFEHRRNIRQEEEDLKLPPPPDTIDSKSLVFESYRALVCKKNISISPASTSQLAIEDFVAIHEAFNFAKRTDIHDLFSRFSTKETQLQGSTDDSSFCKRVENFFFDNFNSSSTTTQAANEKTETTSNAPVNEKTFRNAEVIKLEKLRYFLRSYQEEDESEALAIITVSEVQELIH